MKHIKSSKKYKAISRILTVTICVSLAFALITTPQSEAIIGVIIVSVIVGGVIGWLLHDTNSVDNIADNPALQLSEENLLTAWEGTAERISNQYRENNIDVLNFVNLFNLSYLYWVRQAENEVANVINYTSWYNAKNNMTAFDDFDDSLMDFILSQVAKYSAQDIYVFRDILDTNAKSGIDVTTPDGVIDSTFSYGLRPMVSNRNGDWYLIDIFVPSGQSLKVDGNVYIEGVYQFLGDIHQLSEISSDSILISGFPTNFDIYTAKNYEDLNVTVMPDYNYVPSGQARFLHINRHIDTLYFDGVGTNTYTGWADINGDYHLVGTSTGDIVCYPNAYVQYAHFYGVGGHASAVTKIRADIVYDDLFYRPEPITMKIETTLAGNLALAEHITDRDTINFYDTIITYMKTLKTGMELNAQILFNFYHSHGWFDTDDIPSQYLVVMPDLSFDNIYALAGLDVNEAMMIYYAMLKQLDNETLWAEPNIDSTDITISDFGKWMVKAKLIHASDTIFDNVWVWIVPQSKTLDLNNGSDIVLTQSIMFFVPSTQEMFMGYSGDTLHIYSILEDGEYVETTSITRMSLQEFLITTYGFDVSVFGEWEFPQLVEHAEIYLTIAIACLGIGIPVRFLGDKFKGGKYKHIGTLLILAGIGIIVFVYVLPAIQGFIDWIVFW